VVAAIFFFLLGVVYLFGWKLREKIKEKVIAFKNNFIWNGHIRGQDISYL
jgi:hypothetical protein